MQFDGVAVAEKVTSNGAVPEVGEAEAVQVSVQDELHPVVVMLPPVPFIATEFAFASEAVGDPAAKPSAYVSQFDPVEKHTFSTAPSERVPVPPYCVTL